ncbi:MAG: hypothetical protein O4808_10885 [Trichodesmium sp. St17_bin3_1_1]|nr:hypothetical protein [Trichodesmium sp. St17_bin3_1_1]MDE5121561.1 hypothetical protein [Trichodesmium sp. St19_bin1]
MNIAVMIKKAVITGSGVEIGRAIALDLARKGFDVAFHYNRSAETANQVVSFEQTMRPNISYINS